MKQKVDILSALIGEPLKQIWLYYPNNEQVAAVTELMLEIKKQNCQTGLELNHTGCDTGEHTELIKLVDHISIVDDEYWSASQLKKLISKYWKTHFTRRLFGVKTAAELIMLMKTSYSILEVLLSYGKSQVKQNDTCCKWPQP